MRKKQQTSQNDKTKNLYEPEKILEIKKVDRKDHYLIKWKGYKVSESTWELYSNISHCTWLFEDWERKKQDEVNNQFKNADKIIDKKYEGKYVLYLVRWKNGKEDSWVQRIYIMEKHKKLIEDYEKSEGLQDLKRKHKEKEYNEKENRYLNSDEDNYSSTSEDEDEDDDNSSHSNNQSNNNHDNQGRNKIQNAVKGRKNKAQTKGRQKENSNNSKEEEDDEEDDEDERRDNNDSGDDNEDKQPRRIVKIKRHEKKILYDKLPFYGILGIDEPLSIKNMIIDKKIGIKNDSYFACDIIWVVRPNKAQPVDSRVSRQDIKDFYPQILIQFYEMNMTYDGDVINGEEYNDYESDTKSDASQDPYTIYAGYAKTKEQKKYVKFDQAFINSQMEEMP